jgi:hypothetical protein
MVTFIVIGIGIGFEAALCRLLFGVYARHVWRDLHRLRHSRRLHQSADSAVIGNSAGGKRR